MSRNEIDPPAIVRSADESVQDITEQILDAHGHGTRITGEGMAQFRKVGERLLKLKAKLPHGQFKAWVEKKFPFSYRQAAKYARLAREWDNLPKVNCDSLLTIDKALQYLVEDAPPGELAADGTVPFSPGATNGTAAPETPREPGSDEGYQEILVKKQKVLCNRCRRLKTPACDRCRVKWFNLDNPKPNEPATTTQAKPKKDPNNGKPMFDWEGYRHDLTKFNKRINLFGHAYQCLETGVLEKARDKLLEAHDEFRKAYEQVTKQKVPNWTFLEKVKV